MLRPTLQVVEVHSKTDSRIDARQDEVEVVMVLRRMSGAVLPYHLIDPEVFNAIGDWWDAQIVHDKAEQT